MDDVNVRKLRDTLAALKAAGNERRFDMANYFSYDHGMWENRLVEVPEHLVDSRPEAGCGTAACIAGWAQLIGDTDGHSSADVFAQEWLGLDDDEAERLFMGLWSPKVNSTDFSITGLEDVTLDDAIAELDRMLSAVP